VLHEAPEQKDQFGEKGRELVTKLGKQIFVLMLDIVKANINKPKNIPGATL
jgi:hypothetical protein